MAPAQNSILSLRALNRATLARQLLLERSKLRVTPAVEHLVGLQAQLARPPFLGLWTRLAKFKRDDLREVIARRELVRVTGIRGTLHLMSARDYIALRGALQPALDRGLQVLGARADGLNLPAVERTARAFFHAAPATFDAFRKHLEIRHPGGDERAMAYAVRTRVPLVQVPTEAEWSYPAAAAFALAEDWLEQKVSSAAAPPNELIRRYLAAFGPATAADAQAWSALQGLRSTFEAMRDELVTFRDERKRELFDLPGAPRPDEDTDAPVRFLPEFDNFVLAHQDRSRLIDEPHRSRVVTKNLQVRATFLVDGRVAGIWTAERKKAVATLVLEPFAALPKKAVRAVEEEGDGALQFLEGDAAKRDFRWFAPA
ncbi:MAG: winged helix DNA-binding domain-containing protein [Acidobacteriota bacterium]